MPLEQRLGARAYCQKCRRDTGWLWDGGQNTLTPQADYWRCLTCGHRRLQLANVEDAFALCQHILKRESRYYHRPFDREDAIANLYMKLWEVYAAWRPGETPSFLSHASWAIGRRFWDWIHALYGHDDPRRRHYLKTAAYEVSLDAIAESSEANDYGSAAEIGNVAAVLVAKRGLGGAPGSGQSDPGDGGDAALRRAVQQGHRLEAQGEGILGIAQARRAAKRG
jgi:hypothetical protein